MSTSIPIKNPTLSSSLVKLALWLLFPLIFIVVGIAILYNSTWVFSWDNFTLTWGSIVDTAYRPSSNFDYNGNSYTIYSDISSTCNGSPCNKKGDSVWILVDTNNPQNSIHLWDVLFFLIFPWVGILIGIIIVYSWKIWLEHDRKIYEIVTYGQPISTIVVDVDREYQKKWRPKFKYICRDPKTLLKYVSDPVSENNILLWSTVDVYLYPQKYPNDYFIDLNSVRIIEKLPETIGITANISSDSALASVRSYQIDAAKDIESGFKKLYSQNPKAPWVKEYLIIIIAIIIFTFYAIFTSVFIWIFVILFLYILYSMISNPLREKRKNEIISHNLYSIGHIKRIEKYGFKIVPLGYVPPEEKNILNLWLVQAWSEVEVYSQLGYMYYFVIDVDGREIQSQKFWIPFPEKAKVWAKITVYFWDTSLQDYTIDIEYQ